jgi:hypothetical protein
MLTESDMYVTWSRLKFFRDVRSRGPSSPGLQGIANRVSVSLPLRICGNISVRLELIRIMIRSILPVP